MKPRETWLSSVLGSNLDALLYVVSYSDYPPFPFHVAKHSPECPLVGVHFLCTPLSPLSGQEFLYLSLKLRI